MEKRSGLRTEKEKAVVTVLKLILLLYTGYVFYSTVFGRKTGAYYKYETELFWSVRAALGKKSMRQEIFLNICMLMPFGLFFPVLLKAASDRKRYKSTGVYIYPKGSRKEVRTIYLITIITGFAITCLIEILQLILKRGLFEFDDIIYNTLGSIIGVGINYMINLSGRKARLMGRVKGAQSCTPEKASAENGQKIRPEI